jgi:hypothetical protein
LRSRLLRAPILSRFGPWLKVHLFVGPDADHVQDMKIRSLNLDGRSREFTVGEPHDIADKVFIVRRAYRMNEAPTNQPEWKWHSAKIGGELYSVPVSGFLKTGGIALNARD